MDKNAILEPFKRDEGVSEWACAVVNRVRSESHPRSPELYVIGARLLKSRRRYSTELKNVKI